MMRTLFIATLMALAMLLLTACTHGVEDDTIDAARRDCAPHGGLSTVTVTARYRYETGRRQRYDATCKDGAVIDNRGPLKPYT